MIALVKNGEDQRSMEMENGYDREEDGEGFGRKKADTMVCGSERG